MEPLGISLMDTELVKFAGTKITPGSLVALVVILLATLIVSRLVQAALRRAFIRRGVPPERGAGVTGRIAHYSILLIGFGISLQTIGISIGSLFTAGAIFAVGLGFAMQNIAQNFVSGLILIIERSIRQGDVVEIDGVLAKVREMGIRSTHVRTLEDEDLIVPNSDLVQSTVKNLTLWDSDFRLRTTVGVTYDADMKLVRKTLEEVAESFEGRLSTKAPVILMVDFGSSSVDFEISVWIDDPWDSYRARSRMREAIWNAFKDHGIVIAFPQLDVHFDAPVNETIKSLRRAA